MSVLHLYLHATAKVEVGYDRKDTFGDYDELSTGVSLRKAEVAPQLKTRSAFCSRLNLFCAPKCACAWTSMKSVARGQQRSVQSATLAPADSQHNSSSRRKAGVIPLQGNLRIM